VETVNPLPDVPADAQPIAEELREQILAPVLVAVETALREVAMTEMAVCATYRLSTRRLRGERVALLKLSSAALACLALGQSGATAAALARRILVDTAPNPDAELIGDCLGELVNVAGGQAKALLHGTPWQFTSGTPQLSSEGDLPVAGANECLVALLATDVGEVIVQLFLTDPWPKRERV
jgi:CheY-specific phosphatase CheX